MQLLIFRQDAPVISPHPARLAAEPYRASGLVLWHVRDIPTSTPNVCSLGHFGSPVSARSRPLMTHIRHSLFASEEINPIRASFGACVPSLFSHNNCVCLYFLKFHSEVPLSQRFVMEQAGFGKDKIHAFSSASSAAMYFLELSIIAASYVGLAELALLLPQLIRSRHHYGHQPASRSRWSCCAATTLGPRFWWDLFPLAS